MREKFPEVAVGDVYTQSTIATFAAALDEMGDPMVRSDRQVVPIRLKTQIGQLLALVPLRSLAGARWLSWLMLGSTVAQPWLAFLPDLPGLAADPELPGSSWCRPAG